MDHMVAEPLRIQAPSIEVLHQTLDELERRPWLLNNVARVRLERVYVGLEGQASLEAVADDLPGRVESLVRWVEITEGRGDRRVNQRILHFLHRHPSAPVALPAR